MGLLFPEDPHYNENERQSGFYRYRQLLSVRFGQWWKVNLLTLAGFAPLAAGVFYAVASASVLVLLPCSIMDGTIGGPALAGRLRPLVEAELAGKHGSGRGDGAVRWTVCFYGDAVLVGGNCAFPGDCAAVLLLPAPGIGAELPVLAPAGAVPTEAGGPAAQLYAVLHPAFLAGDGRGDLAAGLLGGPCAVRAVDSASAAGDRGVVHCVPFAVFDL